jgi:hypothetical protein
VSHGNAETVRQITHHILVQKSTHLENRFVGLQSYILDTGVYHKRDQIQDEVGILPQAYERRVTEALETVVMWRVGSTHSIHHLAADLDRRREWLGVSAQNITEID